MRQLIDIIEEITQLPRHLVEVIMGLIPVRRRLKVRVRRGLEGMFAYGTTKYHHNSWGRIQ